MNSLRPILDFYLDHGGVAVWGQGSLRMGEDGISPPNTRKPVCRWCPYGVACDFFTPLSLAMLMELNDRVSAVSDGGFDVIGPWNDKAERTWQDVQELLMMEDI